MKITWYANLQDYRFPALRPMRGLDEVTLWFIGDVVELDGRRFDPAVALAWRPDTLLLAAPSPRRWPRRFAQIVYNPHRDDGDLYQHDYASRPRLVRSDGYNALYSGVTIDPRRGFLR